MDRGPFDGVVQEGYVYGRGAIDVKGGAAVFARAAMMLAESHVPLARDVIFLAEADEEGGPHGTWWLAEEAWPKIDCEFALNEGGWIMKGPDGNVRYVSISTADKGFGIVTVTATGTSTHSSMPRDDNPISTLGRALAKLADYETQVNLIPSTRQFFLALARTSSAPMSGFFRDVTGDETTRPGPGGSSRSPDQQRSPAPRPAARHDRADSRGGWVPRQRDPRSAMATISTRMIPGTDPRALTREIERVIDDVRVAVRLEYPTDPVTIPPSSQDTDLYRALARSAQVQWPGAEVTPYLFQAATDAGAWRVRGCRCTESIPTPSIPRTCRGCMATTSASVWRPWRRARR